MTPNRPTIAAFPPTRSVIRPTPGDSTADTETGDVEAEAARKPAVRPGTKQALLIEMLKRPEGATADQIADVTSHNIEVWNRCAPIYTDSFEALTQGATDVSHHLTL